MQNNQEIPLQDQVGGTPQKSLSGLEKFSLISGAVGLVADGIALSMFIAGFWNLGTGERFASSYVLFVVITGLVFVYGWIVLAWTLSRRALNYIAAGRERGQGLEVVTKGSVAGVGVFLIPLAIIWLVVAFSGGSAPAQSPAPGVLETATPVILKDYSSATLTPNLTVTPTQASSTADDVFGYVYGGVVLFIFLYPILGVGVWVCLMLLMPLVYEDLSAEEEGAHDSAAFDKLMDDVEDDWPKWEERIIVELERSNWVTVSDLQDMADLLRIPVDDLEYVFAKYASLHPSDVRYGYFYGSGGVLLYDNKVLVNAEYDLGEKYLK